jgi:glyceraldehyde-3-phosphate dehydrogenase [NAD(P)+]
MATRDTNVGDSVYVGGRWEGTEDDVAVADLADGGVFERVSATTRDQANAALAAADAATVPMRESTPVDRAAWLRAIADGIEARRADLVDAIVREAGKPVASARSEVDAAAERFRRGIEEARSLSGDYLRGTTESHEDWEAMVRPRPLGVVLAVTPYNYPLSTTALHVAPALAAGNAVVCKPASQTPVSGRILAEIVADTDLPDGAFNYVPGRSSEIGDLLVGDDRVDAVAMTGSSGAGNHIADVSGMVNLHMELGGNAPALVFPDADLDAAADAATAGSFKYAGQRCSAVSRVLVHESVHDALVDRVVDRAGDWAGGDLFDEATDLGPLIDADQAAWVEELIDDAVDRGADLLVGGERRPFGPADEDEPGSFVEPTVLANVPTDARIVREEQFGPVAPIVPVADEAAALSVANDTDLGLDGAVFTADHDRAMRVADAMDVGAVRINGAPSHGIGDVPFGGVKNSGIGREGIGYSVESFTTSKTIVL